MNTGADNLRPLPGEQATTRSPPDISANTHIIALCGTSDIRNGASPEHDGWMVSDFFTWKAIFKGLGASQRWISCLDPQKLVDKYEKNFPSGPYIQGDPYEDDRVIALSRSQIYSAQQDLEILPDTGATVLRDAFLRRFRETYQHAGEIGGSVLLLVASHGDIDVSDGGLVIGLPEPLNEVPFEKTSLLTSEMLRNAIRGLPAVRTTTFLTSCFSENWVITPNWSPYSDPVMAAARKHEESQSWTSSTAGRFGGGVFSTYVLQEVLREARVIEESDSLIVAGDENSQERSWKQWCDQVWSLMVRHQCRSEKFGSLPVFTATNGLEAFWTRSGYGLGRYLQNWNALPKLPKSQYANPLFDRKIPMDQVSEHDIQTYNSFIASQVVASSSGESQAGSWSGARGTRLWSKTSDLARRYLASEPGLDTTQANRWSISMSKQLLAGRLDRKELIWLENILSYRLYCMDEAEKMLKVLGVDMMPIAQWSWEELSGETVQIKLSKEKQELFDKNFEVTKRWVLVTPPVGAQTGRTWFKPAAYLAAAFTMAGKDPVSGYVYFMETQKKVAKAVAKRHLETSSNLRMACEEVRTKRMKRDNSPGKQRPSIRGFFEEPGAS